MIYTETIFPYLRSSSDFRPPSRKELTFRGTEVCDALSSVIERESDEKFPIGNPSWWLTHVSSQVERSSTRLRCRFMTPVFRAPRLAMSMNPRCDTVPHTYPGAGREPRIVSAPSHLVVSAWAVIRKIK